MTIYGSAWTHQKNNNYLHYAFYFKDEHGNSRTIKSITPFRRFGSFSHQTTHILNSWIDRYAINPTTTTEFINFRGAAEEASNAPRGENAESGPDATTSSGLGGLGVDGMVGTDDTVGEGSTPPGEGSSGAMSGDSSWKGGIGGELVKNAGEVEIG